MSKQLGNTFDIIKQYEPIIIQDLSDLSRSKLDLIETLFRQYDLLHYYEIQLQNDNQTAKDTKLYRANKRTLS